MTTAAAGLAKAISIILAASFALAVGCGDEGKTLPKADPVKSTNPKKEHAFKASSLSSKPSAAIAMAAGEPQELASVLMAAKKQAEPTKTEAPLSKAEAAEASKVTDSGFGVVSFTFARDVQQREPVEIGNSFSADGGRVFAHIKLNSADEGTIYVVFKRFDREYYKTDLRIGKSPRWRTWASVGATKANVGSWTVDIQNEDGTLLDSRKFEITVGAEDDLSELDERTSAEPSPSN